MSTTKIPQVSPLNGDTWDQFSASHRHLSKRQWDRQLVMLLASTMILAYLVYRGIWTLNFISPLATILSIGLFVSEIWMSLLLFLYFFQVWKLEDPHEKKALLGRSVDIFVPTYNESIDILRETISSCNALDYPHETYLLDDGNREQMRLLAEELGVHYISRPHHDSAKAGNLNYALSQTSGEFIVVLDADHVPFRHLIDRMIGYFDDPKMGFIQSPHSAYNFDNVSGDWSPRTHQYWEDVNLFHYTVQIGKNHWNAACFCGSAAMFRRTALESVGNFATETITEDIHTGMRIAAKGWKALAVSEPLIVGQAPEDIHTFNVQRVRWGLGNLSVLHFDNPITMRGLTFPQRLNYLGSILSWTVGLPLFFTFLVPIVVLFTTVSPVRDITPLYLALLIGYLGSFLLAMEYVSGHAANIIGIQISLMSSFHSQLKATVKSLFRKKQTKFVVTPKLTRKTQTQTPGWKVFQAIIPQLAVIVLGVVAIFWAGLNLATRIVDYSTGFLAGSVVMLFFIWLALMSVDKSLRCYRRKRRWHYPAVLPVTFRKSESASESASDHAATEPEHGVSAFFNESEIEWIASTPLQCGDQVELVLSSPIKSLRVQVVITTKIIVCAGYRQARGWFYRGEIQNPSNEQLTDLEEIALKYIVPDILEKNYCTRERQWFTALFLSLAPLEHLLGIHPNRVPFVIRMKDLSDSTKTSETIVEEYDSHSFSFVLPHETSLDATIECEMVLDDPIDCSLRPEKVECFHLGGNPLYRYHFATEKLDGATKRRFQDFIRRAATNCWGRAIDRVQARNSILYDAKIVFLGFFATILILGFVGAAYVHDKGDDIFMERSARFETVPADVKATRSRLAAILAEMESTQEQDLDRWLRLYDATVRTRTPDVSAKTADKIADIYTGRNNPSKAAEWKMVSALMYFRIENRRGDMILQLNDIRITGGEKLLTREKRYEYYTMRAKNAAEQYDVLTMERFYREALYLNPANSRLIDEWLASILTMKKKYDAMKHAPHHENDVWISNYERILDEFRSMAKVLPDESDFVSKIAMLSEATNQNLPEAITDLENLAKTELLDEEDQKRLIRLLVKEKRYLEAFSRLRTLDDKTPDTVEFLRLFLWASTPAVSKLSEPDKEWARKRMTEQLQNAGNQNFPDWHEEDFISVTHFIIAFEMLNESESFLRGALKRILETSPVYDDITLQLAMLLRNQKRFKEAEPLLEELLKDDEH